MFPLSSTTVAKWGRRLSRNLFQIKEELGSIGEDLIMTRLLLHRMEVQFQTKFNRLNAESKKLRERMDQPIETDKALKKEHKIPTSFFD